MSLLESNRGSLAGSGYGLGFRMALPKMPSFRVSGGQAPHGRLVARGGDNIQNAIAFHS